MAALDMGLVEWVSLAQPAKHNAAESLVRRRASSGGERAFERHMKSLMYVITDEAVGALTPGIAYQALPTPNRWRHCWSRIQRVI